MSLGRSTLLLAWIYSIFSLALSSYFHLANPYLFLANVYRYEIVGPQFGVAIAFVVPALSGATWLMLLIDRTAVGPWILGLLLSLLFFLAQIMIIANGRDIDCQCFGPYSASQIGWPSWLPAFILMMACTYGLYSVVCHPNLSHQQNI